MDNVLEVREFDTITCDERYIDSPYYRYLDKKHFNQLEQFIKECSSENGEADILEFMKISYKRNAGTVISFNNHVGIIELPSGFQIEILPKVSLGEREGEFGKTKRIFLEMLSCLKEFEGIEFKTANLNIDKMPLYEIFISLYLQEAWKLVKRGLKSAYIQNEDNLKFYKGKLQVARHIKENASHKERFFMQYDEYHINRPENRLIKSTLLKLKSSSYSAKNTKEIGQILTYFEMVEPSENIDRDFSSVSNGRDMNDYEKLIQWAEIFLRNKSFTTFSGKKSGTALLFPMEQVFEAFVAKWVRKIFSETSNGAVRVSAQDRGYYLFDVPRKFRLRPDIVARQMDTMPVIMDTKWKRLKRDSGINYGISQADMYQMYAYSRKYRTPYVWVLYPLHEEVRGMEEIGYIAENNEDPNVNVKVYFVDLSDYKSSLKKLYSKVQFG